jgi:ubiquinone/menaquinone biosynthesis C-methylase UbiE
MTERDYILGTHDAEIARLKLQHSVWRPRMLDAWRRAGITQGQTVIDLGSGPGYAALDIAEIVGPNGTVIAVERSARFLGALRAQALANIKTIEADIAEHAFADKIADALWCRWVFSWLTKPEQAVANLAAALKPGGVAVFHEYSNYASWQLAPHSPPFARFVEAIIESVHRTGAQMDAALTLPSLLEKAGFEILSLTPIVDVVSPSNYVWRWPASFIRGYQDKLVEQNLITQDHAAQVLALLDQAERSGTARMITPTVLEIIARRR